MNSFDEAYASELEKKRQGAERSLAAKLRGHEVLRRLHAELDEGEQARRAGFVFDMTNDGRLAVAKGTSLLAHWTCDGKDLELQEVGTEEPRCLTESIEGAVRATAEFVVQCR